MPRTTTDDYAQLARLRGEIRTTIRRIQQRERGIALSLGATRAEASTTARLARLAAEAFASPKSRHGETK
jgi:hypothetical protein